MSDKLNSLSAAIRLGCSFGKQQAFEEWTTATSSCAIGAGFDALGLPDPNEDANTIDHLNMLTERWPRLMKDQICPVCRWEIRMICGHIPGIALGVHLNDAHRWSREAIADHLESVGL